ncbi:protein kinase [Stigmatella sp. ncwal1]|uniref:Protein kinase n=1 Tax=Stigmatella ashevillensis TaxID=2995309 RepID=A0ABT5DC91_9BACT|nr:serine/threonine-protein kinase [Stigmatella ashevillena]MDC0711141.1 protein kinase [Stigmatella ashevillena]
MKSATLRDSLIGTRVSEYVIQERIGTGGMGIVYLATQPLIGKKVAIKVLKAQFAQVHELVQRMLVEARVVNSIQHPGIIDIFGFGRLEDGRPYVVMELLQGLSLERFLRRKGRLGVEETVKILDEVLDALGTAHRRGVVHRDLKPGNVFLLEGASGARSVKLLDFGIAKVPSSQTADALTVQGLLLGTPEYMSPEQVRGGEVAATSDLYAVGVIAFQMLTGRLPFGGEQVRVLFAQVEEAPPALSSLVPGIPPALERLVLRLLAKEPSQRFQSAGAVRQELKAVLSRKAVSSRPRVGRPAAPVPSRSAKKWWPVAAGVLALSASVAAVRLTVLKPHAVRADAAPQDPEAHVLEFSPSALDALPAFATEDTREAVAEEQVAVERPRAAPTSGVTAEQEPVAEAPLGVQSLLPPRPGVRKAPLLAGTRGRLGVRKARAPRTGQVVQAMAEEDCFRREVLQTRLADVTVRLRQRDVHALTSPAMVRLMEIHRWADDVGTEERCMSLLKALDEWEQKFLSAR